MSDQDRTARTYYYELWRAGTAGILETAGSTFLLVIALRWFQAGALAKALVAGGSSLGLLLSPAVVVWANATGWPTSKAASRVMGVGAGGFLFAGAWLGLCSLLQPQIGPGRWLAEFLLTRPQLPIFVACSMTGMACSSALIPLLTQMYQENYPAQERGRRFSRTVMIRIAMAATFSQVAGEALTGHLRFFPCLLLVFGGAMALASFCLARCPTRPLVADESAHALRALRYVREDRLFRQTLICWMLLGFGNLMMMPLRVEYLANPKYHLMLSVGMIALLTGVIPNLARLALNPVWGHLFDHMNFFALRVTLNMGFAIGILTFFMSNNLAGMIGGALVFGISNAGGDVAWSLWVTKFAPPERVADYMSVHTFLTGVRGVVAPLVGFYCVNHLPLTVLALTSSGLILAATLVLLPELKFGRKAPLSQALVEEVSE